jgi:phosphoribosyl 1,2-cyclic phosphodiesterase
VSILIQDPLELRQATRDLDAPVLTFWGVRGSIPVPGPETTEFGGNTTCIEVGRSKTATSSIIVDAGTGLRSLGHSRNWSGTKRIDLLLTHLHHDHVIGLPFFKPIFTSSLEIHLWCGNLGGETAEKALGALFAPPLFPFTLGCIPAKIVFHGFHAGQTINVAGTSVRTVRLNHPSGATGYRFDCADGSAAIITDIEHAGAEPDPAVIALCAGVDTLVYDSMLDEEAYGQCRGWGHSTVNAAVALAAAAGARRLVGCHHAPEQTDAIMRDREARMQAEWPNSVMARERMRLVCAV